jgi:hypothetical protein
MACVAYAPRFDFLCAHETSLFYAYLVAAIIVFLARESVADSVACATANIFWLGG